MSYPNNQSGFLSSIPPIVKNLIIINLLVFLATQVFEGPMTRYLALYYPESPFFMPHQLFTHMFMHGGWTHIFFNMYALWMFGSPLEHTWGPKRFLIFYVICGIGAALFYCFIQWILLQGIQSGMDAETLGQLRALMHNPDLAVETIRINTVYINKWTSIMLTPMVGASGAIFGVLLGFGMLFPNSVLQLLFPPVRLKAKYFVMLYGLLELFLCIQQPGDSVAHGAHVGGMLFGIILIMIWNKKLKRQNNHWS